MKEKTLLERLGIIERIEPKDATSTNSPSTRRANKTSPASEPAPVATTFVVEKPVETVAEFHFKPTASEQAVINDPTPLSSIDKARYDVDKALADVKSVVADFGTIDELPSSVFPPPTPTIETTEEETDEIIENIGVDAIIESVDEPIDEPIEEPIEEPVVETIEYLEEDTEEEIEEEIMNTASSTVTRPEITNHKTDIAQIIQDTQIIENTQYVAEIVPSTPPTTEEMSTQYLNTDKFASISDLYKSYGKQLTGTNTIFIVDAFAKSLPDTLSANLKKQSVLNIISAANINLEELVADGLSRIDNINSYLGTFKQHTEQMVKNKETQISQLEQQIAVLKREVKERNRLQEKQEATIDFETHRIQTALEFIANND